MGFIFDFIGGAAEGVAEVSKQNLIKKAQDERDEANFIRDKDLADLREKHAVGREERGYEFQRNMKEGDYEFQRDIQGEKHGQAMELQGVKNAGALDVAKIRSAGESGTSGLTGADNLIKMLSTGDRLVAIDRLRDTASSDMTESERIADMIKHTAQQSRNLSPKDLAQISMATDSFNKLEVLGKGAEGLKALIDTYIEVFNTPSEPAPKKESSPSKTSPQDPRYIGLE